MRMRAAARYFDKQPANDAYTDRFAFRCVYSGFDNISGDGSTNRRRLMSVDPDVVIPTRRCVTLGAQRWLVGAPTDDGFAGETIRHTYNVKRVTNLMQVLTAGQAATGASPLAVYAQRYYFKDSVDQATSSQYDTFWNIFFTTNEPVSRDAFLRDEAGRVYHVRGAYEVPEGFIIAQSDQLDADAAQTAVFKTGAYDRATDSFASGSTTTTVLQFEPTKFYRFRQQAESQLKPGDKAIIVSAAVTPHAGMRFTMLSREWQTVTAQVQGDGWLLLARLA